MNTQVRLIPVRDDSIPKCAELLEHLKINSIRADIDDREDTLSKKIRDAETEWIHYTLIIGEKEVASNSITVRDRLKKLNYSTSLDELINIIKEPMKGKPDLPINLPEYLSKRPRIAS
jgi:threonyl-tRNA synthetase